MPIHVHVTDPIPGRRSHEPVEILVPRSLDGDRWVVRTSTGEHLPAQRMRGHGSEETCFLVSLSFEGTEELELLPSEGDEQLAGQEISELTPVEQDAVVRLDTGYFDLELCRGTGQGTGSAKWGLRHFARLEEGVDLLRSGDNAIGGFYGPFFTPENGLINPPEHTVARVEVIERGPVQHHYRLSGVVPDGLLDELKGKRFSIDWRFTYGSPFFERVYDVDPFRTTINGRSVTDKITVGDEFESGRGSLVFDRFAASGGTRYREGDPYAELLVEAVAATMSAPGPRGAKFEKFRSLLDEDLESAHWDLYWRLFCSWEEALERGELEERLRDVRTQAHVLADVPDRRWVLTEEAVDVSRHLDQTIFPGPATKTVEFSSAEPRAMIWWTSNPSGAFQIVQRPQSGWVNWGTNGENECPELPVGTTIKTAYGDLANRWQQVAAQLETAPSVEVELA